MYVSGFISEDCGVLSRVSHDFETSGSLLNLNVHVCCCGVQSVIWSQEGRVNGLLSATRVVGASFLNPYIIPDPALNSIELLTSDELLIIGCAGLWLHVTHEEAVRVARGCTSASQAAKSLRDLAQAYGSQVRTAGSHCVLKQSAQHDAKLPVVGSGILIRTGNVWLKLFSFLHCFVFSHFFRESSVLW